MNALPDVVSDHCTDACKRTGWTLSQLFLKAATTARSGQGFSNPEEVGEKWYRIWVKRGYHALPPVVQAFVLEVNEGFYH